MCVHVFAKFCILIANTSKNLCMQCEDNMKHSIMHYYHYTLCHPSLSKKYEAAKIYFHLSTFHIGLSCHKNSFALAYIHT